MVNDRAVTYHQLGMIYRHAGDIDRALHHWREAIRYQELQGNTYGAAQTRGNIALALAQSGRFLDARDYALAALNGYSSSGAAVNEVHETQELIKQIDDAIAGEKA
jgi:tetratricopeptide (TPR) repeat protein